MRLVTNYRKKRIVTHTHTHTHTHTRRQNNMLLGNQYITKEIKEETKIT